MRYVTKEELRQQLLLIFKDSGQSITGFSKNFKVDTLTLHRFLFDMGIRTNPSTLMKIIKFIESKTGEEIMVDDIVKKVS